MSDRVPASSEPPREDLESTNRCPACDAVTFYVGLCSVCQSERIEASSEPRPELDARAIFVADEAYRETSIAHGLLYAAAAEDRYALIEAVIAAYLAALEETP